MIDQKVIKLPSGATLKIIQPRFAVAKKLWQSMLKEFKSVKVTKGMIYANIFKELFCIGFSSPEIEAALWECFDICLYNEARIDQDTFENPKAREDYLSVCTEVAQEVVAPFLKPLSSAYAQFSAMMPNTQE